MRFKCPRCCHIMDISTCSRCGNKSLSWKSSSYMECFKCGDSFGRTNFRECGTLFALELCITTEMTKQEKLEREQREKLEWEQFPELKQKIRKINKAVGIGTLVWMGGTSIISAILYLSHIPDYFTALTAITLTVCWFLFVIIAGRLIVSARDKIDRGKK